MFAAFPGWYATMFSALYLALVLLLVALIVRGISFEYRGKVASPRWRRTWDWLMAVGSLVAPLLIGIALGDLLHGLPINSSGNYTGTFWDLLQPYAVFTGITLVLVCVLHGATFLCLKTTGDMHQRSAQLARRIAPFTGAAVIGFVIWTHVTASSVFFLNLIELTAILAVIAAVWLVWEHRDGFAFAATTVTVAACIGSIFADLYPNVMVSSTSPAYNLTVHNTASAPYSLKAMTVVAVIFLPLVLGYQAWAYYVFRRRVSREEFLPPPASPARSDGQGTHQMNTPMRTLARAWVSDTTPTMPASTATTTENRFGWSMSWATGRTPSRKAFGVCPDQRIAMPNRTAAATAAVNPPSKADSPR
jgi:cytochrome d ubiquinol oxidase subunit II